jgi:hypothetical protein
MSDTYTEADPVEAEVEITYECGTGCGWWSGSATPSSSAGPPAR